MHRSADLPADPQQAAGEHDDLGDHFIEAGQEKEARGCLDAYHTAGLADGDEDRALDLSRQHERGRRLAGRARRACLFD